MKKLLLIIAVAVFATTTFLSCKDSNPVERIVSLYRDGKISQDSLLTFASDSANCNSVVEWAKANFDKDNIAAWLLGRSYKYGYGVERNVNLAKVYYIKAATGGQINAMRGLANIYETYPGHENTDSAIYWYIKAAEAKDGDCYFNVVQLKKQTDAPIDTAAILDLLQRGAALESPSCISALAWSYYSGDIVPQDKKIAFNMLNFIAEEKLDGSGLYLLGQMYESGEGGAKQSFKTAYRLFKKSADKNTYPDAFCKVGIYLMYGKGVEQNDDSAFKAFKRAANEGSTWGMRCIAFCYANGKSVMKDLGTAYFWYVTAAQNGDSKAIEYCEQHNLDYK